MSATIYLEGGGDSKELRSRCREGFHKLLLQCGYERMPRLVACGSRDKTFDNFVTAHSVAETRFVALWVDSEDPVSDIESLWKHLGLRDNWKQPDGASEEQVLLSTTCMETLIVADHQTLKHHYGTKFQVSALPPLYNLEQRNRHDVVDRLYHATSGCPNKYAKGKRSFEILGKLEPSTLARYLPSFVRILRILDRKLK